MFICYRRDDAYADAGRIHDRLASEFGPGSVFMDVDSVPIGVDFIDYVNAQLAYCAVVVVVIGRSWATIEDRHGRRRLEQLHDLVRGEIAGALRIRMPLIPVLVQNASMPEAQSLPEDIRPLARRNAIALSHASWRHDVEQLAAAIRKLAPPEVAATS